MGCLRFFVLALIFAVALGNHNTRRCGRTRTGRILCTRVPSSITSSRTSGSSSRTSSGNTPSRTQNSGFVGRFTSGFGPNARLGVGLLGSDLIEAQSFSDGGGGQRPPGFPGGLLGGGPFRRIPDMSLARWSRLPGGFF